MRGRLIHWPGLLRFIAQVAIALALIAAAVLLQHHARQPAPSIRIVAHSPSALLRELFRCEAIGERAKDDPDCLAAWAENRHHFFDGNTSGNGNHFSAAPMSGQAGRPSQP